MKRDEQIATIETDKIDVQVNSSDSGIVKGLFFAEGDTVSVGGNLLEIELGESKESTVESTPEVVKPKIAEAVLVPEKKLAKQYTRIPLIKFIGPRSKIFKKTEIKVENSISKNKKFVVYDSINQLPKRYHQIPFSEAEMNAIDVIYTN